ncbi:hypothetical protein GGR57DRAFT_409484 [Xylariaceae sp. FL1272]|nr:hypothetical protein GGR57DRAFT_409484 [Xylariaceae sp. FL1272]
MERCCAALEFSFTRKNFGKRTGTFMSTSWGDPIGMTACQVERRLMEQQSGLRRDAFAISTCRSHAVHMLTHELAIREIAPLDVTIPWECSLNELVRKQGECLISPIILHHMPCQWQKSSRPRRLEQQQPDNARHGRMHKPEETGRMQCSHLRIEMKQLSIVVAQALKGMSILRSTIYIQRRIGVPASSGFIGKLVPGQMSVWTHHAVRWNELGKKLGLEYGCTRGSVGTVMIVF